MVKLVDHNKNLICSGFVAINNGIIKNCYADIKVNGKGIVSGFCGNNSGEISKAYYTGKINTGKINGGFISENTGNINDCFYDKSGIKSNKLVDPSIGKDLKELTIEKTYQLLEWDFETIWKNPMEGNDQPLRINEESEVPFLPQFIPGNFYDDRVLPKDIILISTPEDLFLMADKINNGDPEYCNRNFQLTNTIDLKNKKWSPIGIDENIPFSGIFDGQGYNIINVLVNTKDLEYTGFFGYLKNAIIINLGIEGIIKKGNYVGGLAGANEGSQISCCVTNCDISKGKYSGGFVGKNNGEISHSLALGKVKSGGIAWIPWIIGIAVILLALGIIAFLNMEKTPTYPPVPIDEDVVEIPDEEIQPSEGNSVSFQFDKQIIFQNAESQGGMSFENPGSSNKNIVLELQLTDAEIINAYGNTCRTPIEAAKIELLPSYSPENTRQTICKSGAIPPGYVLDDMKLQALQDGTQLKKGSYNAIMYLMFYDPITNEKAIINTQMPIELIIEN
jgi:hypothetical protein